MVSPDEIFSAILSHGTVCIRYIYIKYLYDIKIFMSVDKIGGVTIEMKPPQHYFLIVLFVT